MNYQKAVWMQYQYLYGFTYMFNYKYARRAYINCTMNITYVLYKFIKSIAYIAVNCYLNTVNVRILWRGGGGWIYVTDLNGTKKRGQKNVWETQINKIEGKDKFQVDKSTWYLTFQSINMEKPQGLESKATLKGNDIPYSLLLIHCRSFTHAEAVFTPNYHRQLNVYGHRLNSKIETLPVVYLYWLKRCKYLNTVFNFITVFKTSYETG